MFIDYLKNILKSNKAFFVPFFLVLAVGAGLLGFTSKGDFLLFLNSNHNTFFDYFFKYLTFLGDGYFVLVVIIIFGIYRIRNGILILSGYLLSGALAQIFKRIFDLPRPKTYFSGKIVLNFVPGVDVYAFHSFPSGHAATAFAYCLMLSILTKNNYLKFLTFLLALFIAISRVYLCQHFLMDIYFGSIIGLISAVFLDYFFSSSKSINRSKWMNYSLIKK